MKKFTALIFCLVVLLPSFVSAKIGVGVGTGKIEVNQSLKSGLIYTLPSVVVLNTGDEISDYSIAIKYREGQGQLKPSESWFIFSPKEFKLEPGQSQMVDIKLSLPLKDVVPGDYFAFLSAYPVSKIETGGTNLGIAAAAKLYFTISPTNFISGIFYRVISIFKLYSPWSYVVLAIVVFAVIVFLFRKFFSFDIGISLKRK